MRASLVAACVFVSACDFSSAFEEWCLESGQCDGGVVGPDGGRLDGGAPVADAVVSLVLSLSPDSGVRPLVGSLTGLQVRAITSDGGSASPSTPLSFESTNAVIMTADAGRVATGALGDTLFVSSTWDEVAATRWHKLDLGRIRATAPLADGGALEALGPVFHFTATAAWPGDGAGPIAPWNCFPENVTLEGTPGANVNSTGLGFTLRADGGALLYEGTQCVGAGSGELRFDGGLLDKLRYSVRYSPASPPSISFASTSDLISPRNRRAPTVLRLQADWLRDAGADSPLCFPAVVAWRIATGQPFAGTPLQVQPNDTVPFVIAAEPGVRVAERCDGGLIGTRLVTGAGSLAVKLIFDSLDGGVVHVSQFDGGEVTSTWLVP